MTDESIADQRPESVVYGRDKDVIPLLLARYQWSHVDFINAVTVIDGMVPCDVIVKADPCASNLKSSKWEQVLHFRRAHAFWIVVRKGRCERANR